MKRMESTFLTQRDRERMLPWLLGATTAAIIAGWGHALVDLPSTAFVFSVAAFVLVSVTFGLMLDRHALGDLTDTAIMEYALRSGRIKDLVAFLRQRWIFMGLFAAATLARLFVDWPEHEYAGTIFWPVVWLSLWVGLLVSLIWASWRDFRILSVMERANRNHKRETA